MTIQLSFGTVVLKDFITHKASRDYQANLFKDTQMEQTGEVDENGRPKMKFAINPANADRANEALVIAMIQSVKLADGTEVAPSRDWLDEMAQTDFSKIEKAVLEIKNAKDEDAKK